jgi:hypothetical protein
MSAEDSGFDLDLDIDLDLNSEHSYAPTSYVHVSKHTEFTRYLQEKPPPKPGPEQDQQASSASHEAPNGVFHSREFDQKVPADSDGSLRIDICRVRIWALFGNGCTLQKARGLLLSLLLSFSLSLSVWLIQTRMKEVGPGTDSLSLSYW